MTDWLRSQHRKQQEEDIQAIAHRSLMNIERHCEDQPDDTSSSHSEMLDQSDQKETSDHSALMSRQQLQAELESILAAVKEKRLNDLKILAEVKREIMAQAEKSCQMLDEYMSSMHQLRGDQLDKQVAALKDIIRKTEKSEGELTKSKTSLSFLCQDIRPM